MAPARDTATASGDENVAAQPELMITGARYWARGRALEVDATAAGNFGSSSDAARAGGAALVAFTALTLTRPSSVRVHLSSIGDWTTRVVSRALPRGVRFRRHAILT